MRYCEELSQKDLCKLLTRRISRDGGAQEVVQGGSQDDVSELEKSGKCCCQVLEIILEIFFCRFDLCKLSASIRSVV